MVVRGRCENFVSSGGAIRAGCRRELFVSSGVADRGGSLREALRSSGVGDRAPGCGCLELAIAVYPGRGSAAGSLVDLPAGGMNAKLALLHGKIDSEHVRAISSRQARCHYERTDLNRCWLEIAASISSAMARLMSF